MILEQFWLTDAQFAKIEPHLPTDTRGKARVDDRRVISGIVHVLKSGGRWVDAPPEYGPKKTLFCNGPLVVNPLRSSFAGSLFCPWSARRKSAGRHLMG